VSDKRRAFIGHFGGSEGTGIPAHQGLLGTVTCRIPPHVKILLCVSFYSFLHLHSVVDWSNSRFFSNAFSALLIRQQRSWKSYDDLNVSLITKACT
jgi:hypothetical protein